MKKTQKLANEIENVHIILTIKQFAHFRNLVNI